MSAIDMEGLKRRVSAIPDGEYTAATESLITTGCRQIDSALPSSGLDAGALHEVIGAGYPDRPAALGFTLGLTARLLQEKPGPLIWCQLRDRDRLHVHAPGLIAFGIDPGRLTKITLDRESDLLWAMEEALECPYLAGVVGISWSEKLYNFTASRRLSLRAKKNGVTALLIRSHRANGATAARTRWRIKAAPSPSSQQYKSMLPRLGQARWRVDLTRSSTGQEKKWDVVWNHEEIRFDLASPMADRAPAAGDIESAATSEPTAAVG